jgi:peptidoglycan/xylan/chitin deacetylase (PgdA/CDA1 family)
MLSASTVNNPMTPTGLVVHLHQQINQASILRALLCIGLVTFSIKDFATQICLGLLLLGGPRNVTLTFPFATFLRT